MLAHLQRKNADREGVLARFRGTFKSRATYFEGSAKPGQDQFFGNLKREYTSWARFATLARPLRQNAPKTARIFTGADNAGLSALEVCGLRLGDVDGTKGTVTVRGKRGRTRILPLSEKGQQAVNRYLEQARLTPAWKPARPEAQEVLLLTELRHPLTKNSLTLLFCRLNQRAEFTTKPISPPMLRDTYAIRFLEAGGDLRDLQEQLGLADRASVRRYQRFCDEQRREEAGTQASLGQAKPLSKAKQSKGQRQKAKR